MKKLLMTIPLVFLLFLSFFYINLNSNSSSKNSNNVKTMLELQLTNSDYIFNISYKYPHSALIQNDFLINALKLRNPTASPIEIKTLSFLLKSENHLIRTRSYTGPEIIDRSKQIKPIIEMDKKLPFGFIYLFGSNNFFSLDNYCFNTTLAPKQETALMFEHFHSLDTKIMDEVIVKVEYIIKGELKEVNISIPLKQHENANEYIFPVKGRWLMAGNYHGVEPMAHRTSVSNEFAWDIIQLDSNNKHYPDGTKNEDVGYYKAELLAIADGEVVDCLDGIPDNPAQGAEVNLMNDPEIQKQLAKEHGPIRFFGGNFVYLRHAGGECSYYAHIAQGSVRVKKGDKVKQGQVIGLMGHSGNSRAIHLHFNLKTGEDEFFIGRSLPCWFTNIVDESGNKIHVFPRDYLHLFTDD